MSDTAPRDLIDAEISTQEACALLGLTAARLTQLINGGHIERSGRGRYRISALVTGYVRFLKEGAKRDTKTASLSRAQDARAREIELRIAEKTRELIPREDAEVALDLVVGAVNAVFTGFAARVTRDVGVRRQIEAEIYEAKRKISAALASGKGVAATGVDASDPDAADAS